MDQSTTSIGSTDIHLHPMGAVLSGVSYVARPVHRVVFMITAILLITTCVEIILYVGARS